MIEYTCEKCNYRTNIKTHYNRHCKTKKHIKNCNINPIKITYLKCSCCKYKTIRKDLLDRHIKTHNKQIETNISGNQIIDFQTKLIDKLIEKSNSANTTLSNSNNTATLSNSNNTATLSNNTINTKNQNVYNYIVNNVKPSTNVQIELEKPFTEEEINSIKDKSALESSYEYIHNRFINNRKADEKLLVCSDVSRNKFSYYNENNEWVIDMKLRNLSELIFDKIVKIIHIQLEFDSNKDDYEKFLKDTLKQIKLYNELKNTLKEKPAKLLNKLYKDTIIDDNYISEHQKLINKKVN